MEASGRLRPVSATSAGRRTSSLKPRPAGSSGRPPSPITQAAQLPTDRPSAPLSGAPAQPQAPTTKARLQRTSSATTSDSITLSSAVIRRPPCRQPLARRRPSLAATRPVTESVTPTRKQTLSSDATMRTSAERTSPSTTTWITRATRASPRSPRSRRVGCAVPSPPTALAYTPSTQAAGLGP